MTPREREALINLIDGLKELLTGLSAEPMLRFNYTQSTLQNACDKLRQALQVEDMLP